MEIKSDYELANVMNIGLAKLANQALNGATEPFQKFKDGADSIVVTMSLTDDGIITVIPYDKKGKIKALEETVKEQEAQVESLTAQVPTATEVSAEGSAEEIYLEAGAEPVPETEPAPTKRTSRRKRS